MKTVPIQVYYYFIEGENGKNIQFSKEIYLKPSCDMANVTLKINKIDWGKLERCLVVELFRRKTSADQFPKDKEKPIATVSSRIYFPLPTLLWSTL